MADARTRYLPALAALLVASLSYLLTAFVLWELNPAEWSETARFWTALTGVMFGGGAAALAAVSP